MFGILKDYIELNDIGFHFEANFLGFLDFTREIGRFVLCDVPTTSPSYYRPSSKTFWVQQAGRRNILATWNGRVYQCEDEKIFVDIIDEVFKDESISGAPYCIPEKILEGRSIHEIRTLTLLKRDIMQKYSLTESDIDKWYYMSESKEDRLSVSRAKIMEFLENNCEYTIDEDSWCDFTREGISGCLRLPHDSNVENFPLTLAIETRFIDSDETKKFFGVANDFFNGVFA